MINSNATGSAMVLTFFASLMFTSFAISYFLISIYGVTVAGVSYPESMSYPSIQNFSENNFNESLWVESSAGTWDYTQGIGKVLTLTPIVGTFEWAYLTCKNIQPDSLGNIVNHYQINNSVHGDYTIVLEYPSAGFGAFTKREEITIMSDGIHQPEFLFNGVVTSNPLIYAYPNANQLTNVQIVTSYNPDAGTAEITFNGATFTIRDMGIDAYSINTNYGGVASHTNQFTLISFQSNNAIGSNGDTDLVTQFFALIMVVVKLIGYNVDSRYFPLLLNIILIKTQTVGLFIGLIAMARGD